MIVYAICKADGSLAYNQSFSTQQEAENEMSAILKDHKELCKTFNLPQNTVLLSVVQLGLVDYKVALEKMEDELLKALNEMDNKQ